MKEKELEKIEKVENLEKLFADRFTKLLNESEMTLEEVAHCLGFQSKGTISKYANGKNKKVSISTVDQIAKLFGVSPIWLMGYTDDKHYIIK